MLTTIRALKNMEAYKVKTEKLYIIIWMMNFPALVILLYWQFALISMWDAVSVNLLL